ncbi:MAG: hypothetical protein IKI34_05235 [Eubacterium sp.]|nr:hypothetical protein [Eubacterium sp.]
MKYFKLLICVILIAAVLGGCNLSVSSSIDDLISPITPMGDNADVKKALDEYASNGYTLKTPTKGKHITSFTFFNLDKDETKEALAFYEPSDNLGSIYMAVIKKLSSAWQVVENIRGEGKDVFSLDFVDVNADNSKEIIVCWDVISNSTSHELCIYKVGIKNDDVKLSKLGESINANSYIPVDMNSDSVNELLVFKIGSGSSSYAGAELYSFKNDDIRILGETKLDSHIGGYVELKTERAGQSQRVYADAISSSGSSMLTELIYWSDSYGTIISPFYSYSSGLTKDTSRNAMLQSMDINSDNKIEIPNDKKLSNLPQEIACINWQVYKSSTLVHTDYSLFAKNDGYTVIIPDKYIDKIKVEYDKKTRETTVLSKESKKIVFSVIPVLKATYDENMYKGYTKILDSSGYYYLAKTNDNSDIKITIQNLKKYIKSI